MQQVEDYRAGVIASLLANIHRDPKKQRQPYTPHDFFPSIPKPKAPYRSAAEIEAAVRAFVRS